MFDLLFLYVTKKNAVCVSVNVYVCVSVCVFQRTPGCSALLVYSAPCCWDLW